MDGPSVPVNLYVCVCVCLSGTVRRFLEKHGNGIEAVVFAASDTEEVRIGAPPPNAARVPAIPFNPDVHVFPLQPVYKKLLPLYFPRSEEEEQACRPLIPADIGNSEGEPIVPERQIRISEKPGVLEGEEQHLCPREHRRHRRRQLLHVLMICFITWDIKTLIKVNGRQTGSFLVNVARGPELITGTPDPRCLC